MNDLASALKKAFEENNTLDNIDISNVTSAEISDPEQVPLMYRAQISGRCSLQYAKKNTDLDRWTHQWVNPKKNGEPKYQRHEPELGLQGEIYRVKISYPWRVFTNCGQDSIFRPVLGKDGIPCIPGSSVKGLFERYARSNQVSPEVKEKIQIYCGSSDKPGILRFHGAYPIGDWAGTKTVQVLRDGVQNSEIRYRIIDVVHPQQSRQVQGTGSPKAVAIASFFEPTLIFELSSTKKLTDENWRKIKGLLEQALRKGIGGKTSSGYGLWVIPKPEYALEIKLSGCGVSPLLRSNEPEFRPNLFKATLRGHASRLLAGVCSDEVKVNNKIQYLFGHTDHPGCLLLYWEPKEIKFDNQGREKTPIYSTEGILHLDAPTEDIDFIRTVLEFSYYMGGFGKSWRRAWHIGPKTKGWHPGFKENYESRAIGCYWEWQSRGFEPYSIANANELNSFLNKLEENCQNYLSVAASTSLNWKEAWHPDRVAVYAGNLVGKSNVIELFHEFEFKTTPAIGGKEPGKIDRPTHFSSVWHRIVGVSSTEYLEIITLFHAGNNLRKWKRDGIDQLPIFIQRLVENGLKKCWGNIP